MNKKVRNATSTIVDGIKFKSILEAVVYRTLLQNGFNPNYEGLKFTLWEGVKPKVPFYNRNKKKNFVLDNKKLIDVTYTPDFTFTHNGILVVIEAKGKENDVFPLKKKMFRKHLETLGTPCIYAEIRSKRELEQFLEIVKNYGKNTVEPLEINR